MFGKPCIGQPHAAGNGLGHLPVADLERLVIAAVGEPPANPQTARFSRDESSLCFDSDVAGLERRLFGLLRYDSKDRDEVYRKAVELRPRQFVVLYTGEISKDAAVVL